MTETELSFLIDLLINPRDPEQLKRDLAERIKEVEIMMTQPRVTSGYIQPIVPPKLTQAPSTLAAMARHGDIAHIVNEPLKVDMQQVEVIAQTPQTAAAMASRQQAIAESIAGKVDKTTGRPKKW